MFFDWFPIYCVKGVAVKLLGIILFLMVQEQVIEPVSAKPQVSIICDPRQFRQAIVSVCSSFSRRDANKDANRCKYFPFFYFF